MIKSYRLKRENNNEEGIRYKKKVEINRVRENEKG